MAARKAARKMNDKNNTEQRKATAKKATEAAVECAEEIVTATEEETVEEKAVETVKKAAPKKEMKTSVVVEYQGKQVEEKEMIAAVKKAWTKSGRKIGEIKTMTLYAKPEESAVYYVINGIDTGAVPF
ncbi:MAG: hypothetical protein KHZ72_01830 [Lachnospiraceae bacterium]|nr:hypothetical protein [Lachnospiraceae bacterium]